jgi:hypothetical protein
MRGHLVEHGRPGAGRVRVRGAELWSLAIAASAKQHNPFGQE